LQQRDQDQSELTRYLDSQLSLEDDPLIAWRHEAREYPALAIMARDILAVPISGVGVERTFNMARDVCHYRRSQLRADTIKKVMIIKHRRRVHLQPQYEPNPILQPRIDGEDGTDEISDDYIDAAIHQTEGVEMVDVDGIDDETSDEHRHMHDFLDLGDEDENEDE
jgi:hypothetical protein